MIIERVLVSGILRHLSDDAKRKRSRPMTTRIDVEADDVIPVRLISRLRTDRRKRLQSYRKGMTETASAIV